MQLTLEGRTIDQEAIELLQVTVGNHTAYATMSGGKDSVVEVDLVRRSGIKHELHYAVTGLDAPGTIRFIRANYPECIFDRPKRTFWRGVLIHGLPTRIARWCCAELKECYGHDRLVITGIRRDESTGRSHRNCTEQSYLDKTKIFLHPIFSWSLNDVWQYIDERQLPHNPLYYENGKRITGRRIGCIGCPMASVTQCKMELARNPGFERLYREYAERYVQARIARGTPLTQKTGEEYFNWWIKRR